MAKKQEVQEKHVNSQMRGLGTYQESTGGGTPIPKGETLAQHPEAHRVQQPRDEDGQFTYNAANRKPLTDYPSRGKTIPPYLVMKDEHLVDAARTGRNGRDNYYIEQMDKYKQDEGKRGKEKLVHTGSNGKEGIYNASSTRTGYTRQNFALDCREYHTDKGVDGFVFATKLSQTVFVAKSGARSNVEKAALVTGAKGDINKMKFTGDRKQLNEAFQNYRKSGIRVAKIDGLLVASSKGKSSKSQPAAPTAPKQPAASTAPKQPVAPAAPVAPTAPAAPTAPKQPTAPVAPSQPSAVQDSANQASNEPRTTKTPFNDNDYQLAKSGNAQEFEKRYADDVQELKDAAAANHLNIKTENIMRAMATGRYKNMGQLKRYLIDVMHRKLQND